MNAPQTPEVTPVHRIRMAVLNARRVVAYHKYPPDDAWTELLAALRCWCGSEIGKFVPGDVLGWGCLAEIDHIWEPIPWNENTAMRDAKLPTDKLQFVCTGIDGETREPVYGLFKFYKSAGKRMPDRNALFDARQINVLGGVVMAAPSCPGCDRPLEPGMLSNAHQVGCWVVQEPRILRALAGI